MENNQPQNDKTRERIDFVKRLLEMNGFTMNFGYDIPVYEKDRTIDNCYEEVKIYNDSVIYHSVVCGFNVSSKSIRHTESLKPLIEFIKLSNQI